MYPSVCYIFIIQSLVLGIFSQSVTVGPDTVKVGEEATLTCTYTLAGGTLAVLAWFKSDSSGNEAGNSLVSTGIHTRDRYRLSNENSLVISNVEVADAGYYLCKVTDTEGNNAGDFTTLTVQYLKTPVLTPDQVSVKQNETATFSCTVPNGVPTPITIRWIKDGAILDVSDAEKYPQSDTTLKITKVNEMDEGEYQCRAENAVYSREEGKLSNVGILELKSIPIDPTQSMTTDNSKTPPDTGDGDGSGGGDGGGLSGGIIAVIVIVILLVIVLGAVGLLYGTKRACFSQNEIKNVDGNREIEGLTDNEITYAQVNTTSNKAPPKPKRAGSATKNPDANVENLNYADLDLKNVNDGKKDQIIRTDPETQYSSVMHSNNKR